MQRALRDAGFSSAPVHVTILDNSAKGLSSGSEGVVTVDLIITVQKPDAAGAEIMGKPEPADAAQLIRQAITGVKTGSMPSASHLYAGILRRAIERYLLLDELHLSGVLIALRQAGYGVDRKTGLLQAQAPDRAAA